MADNIFEQLIEENRDIIISENPNLTLNEQEKSSRRASSKAQKNINKIKETTNKVVDFIVSERNKISIPVIDTNEEIFKQARQQTSQSIQTIISDLENQNITQNAASRIDYVISQEIENTISNSSAGDIYKYKKSPGSFSQDYDMTDAILKEIDLAFNNINYIARSSLNKTNNEQQAKDILK